MADLKKEELVLVDMVLAKLPYQQAINILPFIDGLPRSGNFQFEEDVRLKIYDVNARIIRTFLLEQGYTEPVNHSIPSDKLIEKGKKAKELGGHEKYLEWVRKEEVAKEKREREQNRISFPQRYWWLFAVGGWIIGVWTDIGKEALKRKIWPESNQSQPSTRQKGDTVYLNPDSLRAIK